MTWPLESVTVKIPTKWRKSLVYYAMIVAVLFTVIRFAPWLFAQAWYIAHFDGVQFQGKIITVPRGAIGPWRTESTEKDILFTRYASVEHNDSVPRLWSMYFSRDSGLAGSPRAALQNLGANLRIIQSRTRRSGTIFGPERVPTQEGNSWCFTTTMPHSHDVSVTCLLFDAKWYATYDGPSDHAKEFFKVIARIRNARK